MQDKRWLAIEKTYVRAREAMAEMGAKLSQLDSVFQIRLVHRFNHRTMKVIYCWRHDFPKVQKWHKSKLTRMEIQPGCKPYQPRKGEPTFNQWLSARKDDSK